MVKVILDTNVVSGLRKPAQNPEVASWLRAQRETDLFLSAITLGEIERGVVLQEKKNPEFAAALRTWLNATVSQFSDRILEFSAQDARVWGGLSATLGHAGADLMIAATALNNDARVATRNTTDFIPTGVPVVNPFDAP
ncbi:PIN domain-containing protein [Roseobacter sp. A03A-229]